jgi:hypothetical protein
MLTSSKSVPRKWDDDTEDTEDREVRGATDGEKPPKVRKPMDGTGTKQGREAGCGMKRRGSAKLRGRREVGEVAPMARG